MAIKTEKSVVYHIPKCGGIWVKQAIRESGLRYERCKEQRVHQSFGLKREHATPRVVCEEDKIGRLSSCFVRHPLDWYRSFWAYRAKTGWLGKEFPLDKIWEDEYEMFVLNVLDAYPDGFVTRLYQYYVDSVDFVGRQERLTDDLVQALTLAGEEFDEEALRQTKWHNMAGMDKRFQRLCVLSDRTRDRIIDSEKWVMETFYGDGICLS